MRFIVFFTLLFSSAGFAQISHLEIGAANYGGGKVDSPHRFKVLELTAQDLIAKYGPTGVIYLNDIFPDGLQMAVDHLRAWLQRGGYVDITVVPVPGDYNLIPLIWVKSAHLTHPGNDQLPSESNPVFNRMVVSRLERIASYSESGLRITSYWTRGDANYMASFYPYLSESSTLKKISDDGYPYFHPQGLDWENPREGFDRSDIKTFELVTSSSACARNLR